MTIEELARALTEHADDLQLYANGIAEDAEAELAATEDSILVLVYELYQKYQETGLQMDYKTVKYLQDLKKKIAEIRAAAFDDEEDGLDDVSHDVAKEESGFLSAWFAALVGGFFPDLTEKDLDRIAKYGIYNGNTQKQIFEKLLNGDVDRIYSAISNSFQKGKSVTEAVQAVRMELQKSRRYVKSEIEAIINGVANDAALAFSAANKTKLLYSSVLDGHVCDECESFEGQLFDYDDPELPSLPRHINCRCRLIPAPDKDSAVAPVSFAEYLASLTPSGQLARLGKKKYDAMLSGAYKPDLYEMANRVQRLSMDELKARYKKRLQNAVDLNPHGYMTIIAPVSNESIVSLRRYTCGEDGMYRKINEYMRSEGAAQQDKKLDGMVAEINSVMHVSALNEDKDVFRGMRSSGVFKQIMEGLREFRIDCFQSTSISKEVSEGYAGHKKGESILMKIKLPKGTHCVDVSKISAAPNKEEEILVNPTGKFKITGVYYNEAASRLEVEAIYER